MSSPYNPLDAQHVCIQCVKHPDYGGCCRVPKGMENYQLPITESDVMRIEAYTGLHPSEIADSVPVQAYQRSEMESISPAMGAQVTGGFKLKLKLKENGECKFLVDGKGCTLGEHKPRVCLSFPWFVAGRAEMKPCLGDHCLALHASQGDQEKTMDLLGMNSDMLEKLRREIIADTMQLVANRVGDVDEKA